MATITETKRVLIADPSDKSRQALSTYLREKGLEIIEVADGSKALAETLLRKPDILLLEPMFHPQSVDPISRYRNACLDQSPIPLPSNAFANPGS